MKHFFFHYYGTESLVLKLIYSKKTTKFCKIFTLLLSVCNVDKSKVEISQNFVAFSDYTNFKIQVYRRIFVSNVLLSNFKWISRHVWVNAKKKPHNCHQNFRIKHCVLVLLVCITVRSVTPQETAWQHFTSFSTLECRLKLFPTGKKHRIQDRRNVWGQWGFVPIYFCKIH